MKQGRKEYHSVHPCKTAVYFLWGLVYTISFEASTQELGWVTIIGGGGHEVMTGLIFIQGVCECTEEKFCRLCTGNVIKY